MSDIGNFIGLILFVAAAIQGFKMWLYFKKPEAYKKLEAYEEDWREKRNARMGKALGGGLKVGGILLNLFRRR